MIVEGYEDEINRIGSTLSGYKISNWKVFDAPVPETEVKEVPVAQTTPVVEKEVDFVNRDKVVDRELIDKAGLLVYQQVDVLNITNGNRLTTYVIEAEPGSKTIGINGAAAHLVNIGDKIIICAYADMSIDTAQNFNPNILILDENNNCWSR